MPTSRFRPPIWDGAGRRTSRFLRFDSEIGAFTVGPQGYRRCKRKESAEKLRCEQDPDNNDEHAAEPDRDPLLHIAETGGHLRPKRGNFGADRRDLGPQLGAEILDVLFGRDLVSKRL